MHSSDIQYSLTGLDQNAVTNAQNESVRYRTKEGQKIADQARERNSYIALRKKSFKVHSFLDRKNDAIQPKDEFYALAYPPTEDEVKNLRFVQDEYGINADYVTERAVERVVARLPQRGIMARIATRNDNRSEKKKAEIYRELDERNIWYSENSEDIHYLAYEKEIGSAQASNELYSISAVDEAKKYTDAKLEEFFEDDSGKYWLWLINPGACFVL